MCKVNLNGSGFIIINQQMQLQGYNEKNAGSKYFKANNHLGSISPKMKIFLLWMPKSGLYLTAYFWENRCTNHIGNLISEGVLYISCVQNTFR